MHLRGETSTVARCCQSVSERGFVNYFGPQRFGSQMIRSFHVGSAILERRFDDAVRLILGDASSLGSEVSKVVAAAAEIAAARSRLEAQTYEAQRFLRERRQTGGGHS
ncbi:unnamed protein product [Polarella glacialis]|uniref:TRUD domain-containing protein n=1 Tax=Polarella glacialis TaxID=89957 RepID=A0A813LUJ5_POLGL|nr:unnamed protein product [Polarella glacialis]CAE8740191.1 unnamed protein product [Polarella glacialis]